MKVEMPYRILGWSRRADLSLGACLFSVELDARFAEKARAFTFVHQQRFVERVRELTGDKYARVTFLEDTGFLRSMAVEGNCCCLGMNGGLIDSDWGRLETIRYDGHNIDSKTQAYDLLTIFNFWVDTMEAFVG